MQVGNLYKLVTREDPFHLHKLMGVACLGNFFYRYWLVIVYGNMFLYSPAGIYSIALHALLSLSSLVFHVPSNRIQGKPMIYPEMRLHTIVFTMRSVLCCLTYYFSYSQYTRMAIIFLTMMSADLVTYICNRDGSNGTTIRNMPYDPNVSEETKEAVKLMNSRMQIGATLFMLGNIDSAFFPMFAIQLSALLSTLVRKSIISANMWHIVYALSLGTNVALYMTSFPLSYMVIQGLSYTVYTEVFFKYNTNKYLNWSIIFALFIAYERIGLEPYYNYLNYWAIYGIRTIIVARLVSYLAYTMRGLFYIEKEQV